MSPQEALIALNMLPKIGPVRVQRLIERFGSAEKILTASTRQLCEVSGIGEETANTIRNWEQSIDLASELRDVETRGLKLITQHDPDYPAALRQMYDPPLVLYVWGNLSQQDQHAVAIVGSRKTTHYGTNIARQFGFQLATNGITIVSGLARGIDTHAHQGAIAAKGRTLAVIGSGLSQIYPPENMPLAEKIADGCGAVISEFPLAMPPSKKTFPMRNRVVAALSRSVLVVECPEWSGARITANLAGEMGKNLYAIPGPIDRPTSAGCNAMIREGAILTTSAQDILSDFETLDLQPDDPTPALPPLAPEDQSVFDAITQGNQLIDEILAATQLPLPAINAILLKLELSSRIRQIGGGRFVPR